MDKFTSEEISIHNLIQYARNKPIDTHLAYYCIEMFLIDYPEHFRNRDDLLNDAWKTLQKLLSEACYSPRDLLVMFLYIQRYYQKPKQYRSLKLLPKTILECSAFACINYETDEHLSSEVWKELTGVSWHWVLYFSIRFCQEIEYNFRTTPTQIWTCYNILTNTKNIETVIFTYQTMVEISIQPVENNKNIVQN